MQNLKIGDQCPEGSELFDATLVSESLICKMVNIVEERLNKIQRWDSDFSLNFFLHQCSFVLVSLELFWWLELGLEHVSVY